MLELKAPPIWNGPNTRSLAPGVRKRVNKKMFKGGRDQALPGPVDVLEPLCTNISISIALKLEFI